jgi:asparagine synthase (glutamine-hydrolysing)
MCGIAGAIDQQGDVGDGWVRAINDAQVHRGPDDAVALRCGGFVLGNTRLAILDTSPAGNQPFADPAGRFIAVLNGEIYNYLELIDEHQLDVPNGCDGAVIPLLWAKFGTGTLDLLRGMYAIALLDTLEQHLVLARDPFGIKPLYWRSMPGDRLVFASEPRALARLGARPRIRQQAIASFLNFGALRGDASPFEGVFAVPGNSFATFHVGAREPEVTKLRERHLGLHVPEPAPGGVERMAATFQDAVRLHLRSDVPTALLLSAGIDSTAIACVASRLGQRLQCLTVDGPGMSGESALAAATAANYRHDHQRVEADLLDRDIPEFFDSMQRPTIDGLNTFVVCKAVKTAGYKVALSGLGGDEALGGYGHARLLPWLHVLRAVDALPRPVATGLARAGAAATGTTHGKFNHLLSRSGPRDALGLSRLQRELFPPSMVHRLCGELPELPPATDLHGDNRPRPSTVGLRALAVAEVETYMTSMLLPDSDAFSMKWSVELRVPFIDKEFFACALTLADTEKRFGKATLVGALGDGYLLDVSRRKKTGFGLPMKDWIETGVLAGCRGEATDRRARVWDYLDRDEGLRVVTRPDRWSERWSVIALNGWLSSL